MSLKIPCINHLKVSGPDGSGGEGDPLCRASNPLGFSLIHIFPNSLLNKYLLSTYHMPDPVLMPRIWW